MYEEFRSTSNALIISSLVCAAERQMRALANNKGVAGKATVTTANCKGYNMRTFSNL